MAELRIRKAGAGIAALLALTAGALVACSPSSSDKGGDDTLTVARTGDIDLLDPARATAFQTVQSLELVYDTLVDTDDDGKLVPGLAEKWTVAPDGKLMTFTLRSGVTFHDGTKLTAADAKATLDRVLDPKTASVVASYLGNVTAVAAPDEQTLTLTLKQPDASLLTALSYVGTSILAGKDITADTVGKKPNGTGPYQWKSWHQGQSLKLTANPKYFGGAAKTRNLEFRVIPDEASVLSGMKAGSFDLGLVTDPAVAKQSGSKVQLLDQPTLSYHVLQLNGRKGPLAKPAVRQAIACAIDRKDIVDSVYFGDAKLTGPITSPAYEYDATKGLPCEPGDLDAAKDMLAKAGYPRGFTLHTIVMTGAYSTSTNIGQALQGQLSRLGVSLDLDRQPTTVYVPAWKDAKFDAAVALNGGSADPYLQYSRYFTSGGSLSVPAGLSDPELDRLLREGNASTDYPVRKRTFEQLQQRLLVDSPWVWLFRNQTYYLLGENVTGFHPSPTESLTSLRTTTFK